MSNFAFPPGALAGFLAVLFALGGGIYWCRKGKCGTKVTEQQLEEVTGTGFDNARTASCAGQKIYFLLARPPSTGWGRRGRREDGPAGLQVGRIPVGGRLHRHRPRDAAQENQRRGGVWRASRLLDNADQVYCSSPENTGARKVKHKSFNMLCICFYYY